jgi:hypothetical protein
MDVLTRIRNAGFVVKLDGDAFTVKPSNQLTDELRAFLNANKVQIMDALLMTVVYTPSGSRMELKARDAEHQDWLIARNHNSPIPIVALDAETAND